MTLAWFLIDLVAAAWRWCRDDRSRLEAIRQLHIP
jgi:hypothetical protein